MTIVWCMVPELLSAADSCHFGQFFALLSPPTTQKIKILEKWKKTPGDIIILHKCAVNDNNMMYGSSDMRCDRQNFFVILDHFLPFYPPNNLKNQNFEKLKKIPGDIMILHKCTKNHDHMLYCFLDMMPNGFNCYFTFWATFFTLLSP